jgi:hypothetical protein
MSKSQQTSFEDELKKSVSVIELEERLEMVQAFGLYCCEYGEHPPGANGEYTSCGTV